MQVTFCDACKQIIKAGDRKTFLGFRTMMETSEDNFNKKFKNVYQELKEKYLIEGKVYELCEKCRALVEKLFKMRRQELEKLQENIENIYNLKPENNGRKKKNGK